MISVVVLAAGASRRMGKPKQLLLLGGKPLVWHGVYEACRSAAEDVVVVTGACSDLVAQAIQDLPARAVYNPEWAEGQAASVKAGIAAIHPRSKAVLFLPADQPMVTAGLLNLLINEYRGRKASILVPVYQGRRGTPVLFDCRWKPAIRLLQGDQGARSLIDRFPAEVGYVNVADEYLLLDADTPDDYRELQRIWQLKEDDLSGKG